MAKAKKSIKPTEVIKSVLTATTVALAINGGVELVHDAEELVQYVQTRR